MFYIRNCCLVLRNTHKSLEINEVLRGSFLEIILSNYLVSFNWRQMVLKKRQAFKTLNACRFTKCPFTIELITIIFNPVKRVHTNVHGSQRTVFRYAQKACRKSFFGGKLFFFDKN